MYNFAVYQSTTGRIIRWGNCSIQDDIRIQAIYDGELVIESGVRIVGPDDPFYVVNATLTPRPVLPRFQLSKDTITADGVDTLTIAPLPVPTTVKVTDGGTTTITVDDGVFALSSEKPGTFKVKVDPFPNAVQEFVINAV